MAKVTISILHKILIVIMLVISILAYSAHGASLSREYLQIYLIVSKAMSIILSF